MMNIASRTRAATRRWSLIPQPQYQHPRTRSSVRNPPVMWNIQGMRGQMSTNCLWHACRAFSAGLLIFLTGAAMCVAGFHADGVLDFGNGNNNTTDPEEDLFPVSRTISRDPSRPLVKFSKLSYIGPFVMGVGGFIIVATCVMTFEARDSAAKVGPAAFGTSNSPSSNTTIAPLVVPPSPPPSHPPLNHSIVKSPREVRSIGCQTSYSFSNSTLQLFDKRYIMDAFRKFSKTLRSSTSITSSGQGGGGGSISRRRSSCTNEFHRSPSAPSLLNPNLPIRPWTNNTNTKTKYLVRSSNRSPRVPAALRQAMSMDYSSSSSTLHPHHHQRSNYFTTSTQTLTVPGTTNTTTTSISPHSSRLNLLQPKGVYRNLYSTSSEYYPMRSLTSADGGDGGGGSFSNSSTPPQRQASFIIEDESIVSVHSPPQIHESSASNGHSPGSHLLINGVGGLTPTTPGTLSVLKPSFSGGSASSLRTLSPHASYYSDDSFDRGSIHSEQLLPKSPTPGVKSRSSSYRSTDSTISCGGRPSLMRQSRVDYSEIIVQLADEEEDEILPPVEDLTTIPE